MKKTALFYIGVILVMSATDRFSSEAAIAEGCGGVNDLDIPNSALLGQWRESELLEMRSSTGEGYWLRKNHVLTREGQITTREEICGDEMCLDVKSELTHFGTFTFDEARGRILKSYRKHFYSAHDDSWMRSHFALERCPQLLPAGQVVSLEHPSCLDALHVRNEQTWKVEGATLQSLALRNCGPQLRANNNVTRELVRMF